MYNSFSPALATYTKASSVVALVSASARQRRQNVHQHRRKGKSQQRMRLHPPNAPASENVRSHVCDTRFAFSGVAVLEARVLEVICVALAGSLVTFQTIKATAAPTSTTINTQSSFDSPCSFTSVSLLKALQHDWISEAVLLVGAVIV